MARRKAGSNPSYRLHKASGQAIVSLPRGDGSYRDYLLGEFNTDESRAEYDRLIAEWKSNGRRAQAYPDTTIAEMCAAFIDHAEKYYRRPDGSPTNETVNFRAAFRPLTALYAHKEARNFDTLALVAVREKMIEDKLSRKVINSRINRIRHVFKWGVAKKMVPVQVHQALQTVAALSAGRSDARETEAVKPVSDQHVDAILPLLLPRTRAIIELLRFTGARPGEIVQMRRADIDMGESVWVYRPRHHKNLWRGKKREIAIGPKGQEILKQFFKPDIEALLFSPRDAIRYLWDQQRASRKSKVYASQCRDQQRRLNQLNESYSVAQLDRAISRACGKASIPVWSANQLRHLHATKTRRNFGIEAAAAALGHHNLPTTELYAEADLALAAKVATVVG